MTTYDLIYENGYLLIALCDGAYVLDTGAPRTFGNADTLAIGGETLPQLREFAGLTAGKVSATAGQPVQGLLGTDILDQFDILVDIQRETVTFSTNALTLQGEAIPLRVPRRCAYAEGWIGGRSHFVSVRYGRADQLLARRSHRGTGRIRSSITIPPMAFTTATVRADAHRGAGLEVRCGHCLNRDRRDGQDGRRIGIRNEIMLRSPVPSHLPRRSQLLV